MTRYLLDTNIISHVTKPVPSQQLMEWMAEQADGDLFISSLSLGEILRGVLGKTAGKKRRQLEEWFQGLEGPLALFRGRVLAFDDKAALTWGRLMSEATAAGPPRSSLDTIVAAIAEANQCVIVTDNEKHFPGAKVRNPLRGAKSSD